MSAPITAYKPCESLRPFVEVFWEGSFNANALEPLSMRVIPSGCVELIIHLNDLHCELQNAYGWSQSPEYMIIGLFTRPYEVHFNNLVKVFSMRFKPEGIYNIFGIPASVFNARYEDMSLVLGSEFRDFSHRLKEEKSVAGMINRAQSYLMKNLMRNNIELNYVNRAAELIRQTKGLSIEELSGYVFISQRQLEREFKEKVGITPKHYLRIMRLNEAQRLLNDHHPMNLTSIAYQCGYFDQAHFIRDFRSITGEVPSIFIKGRSRFIANSGLAH